VFLIAIVLFLFSYKYFPNQRGGVSSFGMAPSSRQQANARGDNRWGTGQRLGDD